VDVNNYSITLDTANDYVVDAKAITYSIAAGNITYGNVDNAGSISYTGVEVGDDVSASAQIDNRVESTAGFLVADTYTQSLDADGHVGVDVNNYSITLDTANDYVVDPYDLTATIADVSETYGADVSAGSVTLDSIGLDDVAVSASIVDPSYSTALKLKAGTYSQITGATADLTGDDAANYTLTATTSTDSVTVAQYDLTATIADVSETYGADVSAGSVTLDSIGLDDVAVSASIVDPSYSTALKLKAGTYSQITGATADLTGDDAANYTLTATTSTDSVTVDAKAITYSIAAGNITYGNVDSAGSISYTGVEVGDDVSASAQIDNRVESTAGFLAADTYTQSIGC
jgi:hypothetical protein